MTASNYNYSAYLRRREIFMREEEERNRLQQEKEEEKEAVSVSDNAEKLHTTKSCPVCGEHFTNRGIKNHMRACKK